MHYYVSFKLCNHLEEEKRAGYFAFIVLRMACYCKCSVTRPPGAVAWSAVCDCGIFGSFLLKSNLLLNHWSKFKIISQNNF